MLNVTTITRPYAKAIISLARDGAEYDKWSMMLEFLALIASDPSAEQLLSNLSMPHEVKAQFICDVAAKVLSVQAKNLVKVLARNKRLLILPELYRMYQELQKQEQHQLSLKLISAEQPDAGIIMQLRSILEGHFEEHIILEQEPDATLIAGGKLKIGDRVLNSSVQNRLKTLYMHLTR